MPLNFSPVLCNLTKKEQSRKIVEPEKVEALITETFLHIEGMALPSWDDISHWSHCSRRQGLKYKMVPQKKSKASQQGTVCEHECKCTIFIKSKSNI